MAPALTAVSVAGDDWEMFLGNPRRVNVGSESIPDQMKVKWSRQLLGESDTGGLHATPTIDNGKLYIGAGEDIMFCLDTDDGGLEWTYSAPSNPQTEYGLVSTACVDGGRLYFGSSDYCAICLDPDDGSVIWSKRLVDGEAPPATYGVCSSPVVSGGRVYFGTDFYEEDDDKPVPANLHCLDASGNGDGTTDVIWRFTSGRGEQASILSSPAIEGNKLVVGTWSTPGEVMCLDARGGSGTTTLEWTFPMTDVTMASPAIHDGTVYIGYGNYMQNRPRYNLYAIPLDSEGELSPLSEDWHYTTSGQIISTAVPHNDRVYLADMGGTVHCIDGSNPGFDKGVSADWTFETGEQIWATPLLMNDRLVVGNFAGDLYCLDSSTGSQVWKIHLSDAEIYSSAVWVDDNLYVATVDGKVFCLEEGEAPPDNNLPELTTGTVLPVTGDATTTFTFNVVYTDADDDEPRYVRLVVDDDQYLMTPGNVGTVEEVDGVFSNGEIFEVTTQLAAGEHDFAFTASDGFGTVNINGSSLVVLEAPSGDDDDTSGDDTSPDDDDAGDEDGTDYVPGSKKDDDIQGPLIIIVLVAIFMVIALMFLRGRGGSSRDDERGSDVVEVRAI